MTKVFSAFVLLFFTVALQAQKIINDPNVEARNIKAFTGISVSGGIDLYLSYGDEAVAVSASKTEFRDKIKTEVVDGILKIYYEHKNGIVFTNDRRLKAYVSYKTLNSLTGSGGSDIEVDGIIKTNKLKMDISGGSDFNGKVEASELDVEQSGGSDIKIAGTVSTLIVNASGGSDFEGYDLRADVCKLEASGGCDIEITANRELSAKATGASDVSYKGKPALKEVKASGASSVTHKS